MIHAITSEEQLRALLAGDEHEHLEFKKAENTFSNEDLFGYCVALANEGGGTLILGVADKRPGKVVGTNCFRNLNTIKNTLLDTLRFRVDVSEFILPEGRVLAFSCPPRPIGSPRAYKGQYFMRAGESLVPMTPDVLQRIFAENTPDYSQQVCPGATLDDLAPEATARFRALWVRKTGNKALEQVSDAQLLADAGLVEDSKVTYAALVLLAKPSSLGRLLPQAELVFEYRSSLASIACQDRVEYRAGFFLWSDEIWHKINARNEKYSYRDGMLRYEIPAFNEDVVREGLLNAIAHREYRDGGSIFVRQFPDQLEIVSPGGFPSGITEENIIYRQNPRNRRIAEVLQLCGLVERSGQGADRMYRVCIQEGKHRPQYTRSDATQVSLLLDGQVRDARFVQYLDRLAHNQGMSLTIEHFLVLDRVREGEPIPSEQRKFLMYLVEQGVIEKVGRGRGVKYVLSGALYRHIGEAGTYTRRKGLHELQNRELVIQHIRNTGTSGATREEFEQLFPNKTVDQIKWLLRQLKKEGRILVKGRAKGARWFLNQNEGEEMGVDWGNKNHLTPK